MEDSRGLAWRGRDPRRGGAPSAPARSNVCGRARRRPGALSGMSVTFEVVEDPARACAALMVSAAIGGGEIVLAGGSTPKTAYEHFVDAVKAVGLNLAGSRFWI